MLCNSFFPFIVYCYLLAPSIFTTHIVDCCFQPNVCILALYAAESGAYLDVRGFQDCIYSEVIMISCFHLYHILNCTCASYNRQLPNDLFLKHTDDRAQIFIRYFCVLLPFVELVCYIIDCHYQHLIPELCCFSWRWYNVLYCNEGVTHLFCQRWCLAEV